MYNESDNIVVVNARKAVSVELATNRALGFSVNVFDAKTKTISIKSPNGQMQHVATSRRGRYSERHK